MNPRWFTTRYYFTTLATTKDHLSAGYATKELYSAALATECLASRKVLKSAANKVTKAILSTHRDGRFVTTEQKAVRAADLAGLAADYTTFRDNTTRLKLEHELLTGNQLAWSEWARRADDAVRYYLSQEIRLTSYYTNEHGESAFHAAVLGNLRQLHQEFG